MQTTSQQAKCKQLEATLTQHALGQQQEGERQPLPAVVTSNGYESSKEERQPGENKTPSLLAWQRRNDEEQA